MLRSESELWCGSFSPFAAPLRPPKRGRLPEASVRGSPALPSLSKWGKFAKIYSGSCECFRIRPLAYNYMQAVKKRLTPLESSLHSFVHWAPDLPTTESLHVTADSG